MVEVLDILDYLDEHGESTVQDLCEHFHVTANAIRRKLWWMEDRDYVVSRTVHSNSHYKLWKATGKTMDPILIPEPEYRDLTPLNDVEAVLAQRNMKKKPEPKIVRSKPEVIQPPKPVQVPHTYHVALLQRKQYYYLCVWKDGVSLGMYVSYELVWILDLVKYMREGKSYKRHIGKFKEMDPLIGRMLSCATFTR